jgi:hypothetical protein
MVRVVTISYRWSLWLVTFGCCAAGLVVDLVVTRPLTLAVVVQGAVFALAFPLGSATVGLVLARSIHSWLPARSQSTPRVGR